MKTDPIPSQMFFLFLATSPAAATLHRKREAG